MRFGALVLLIVASVVTATSAQERPIPESEYDAVLKRALGETERHDRSVVTFTRYYSGENVTAHETKTEEFQGPNRWRVLVKFESGKMSTTREIVEIGDASYRRQDGSIWSRWSRQKDTLRTFAAPSDPREQVSYTINEPRSGEIHLAKTVITTGPGFQRIVTFTIISDARIIRVIVRIADNDDPTVDPKTTESKVSYYLYEPKGLNIQAPITSESE